MNNIISEHLLNMDEWNLLEEGEGWDGKSSGEQQDTNRNSLALPFPIILKLH